jgi:hypothetical protein
MPKELRQPDKKRARQQEYPAGQERRRDRQSAHKAKGLAREGHTRGDPGQPG